MKKKIFIILICWIMILVVTGCNNNDSKLEDKDNNKSSYIIVDEVSENQLICADALDPFYEDENYVYSWPCVKNDYMKIKYEDGSIKQVSEALKDGSIKITDLDENNIKYYKDTK